jgi:hypothetical protein
VVVVGGSVSAQSLAKTVMRSKDALGETPSLTGRAGR